MLQSTVCVINGVCYQNGAVNPNDINQICAVDVSKTSWSTVQGIVQSVLPRETLYIKLVGARLVLYAF